ncbi:hypothetical protein ACYCFC_12275 [Stutzerimonas sp. NM35]
MTVSFRLGRYLVALLWHWSGPAIIGFVFGSVLATLQIVKVVEASEDHFYQALARVIHHCGVIDLSTDTEADQGGAE